MFLARRDFMRIGSIGLGATVLSSTALSADVNTTDGHDHDATVDQAALRFDPSGEPHRIRKNFYDLTDLELRMFMKAVGYMRGNYQLRDPRMWDNYALTHALHCTEPNPLHQQVHWGWNFLPWHRGYLYFLERILANILTTEFAEDGTKFALPYWDWSTQHGMPNTREREKAGLASPFFGYDLTQEDMTEADDLGFDNAALLDGNRGPTIQKPQMDPANENTPSSKQHVAMTRYYMSPEYINMILAAPWDQFGGQPVIDRTGQGLLEAGPHNCGHDWVGVRIGRNRDMGTLRSAANDPIFFMHHCNIDRIWSLYEQPQPDPYGDWGKPVYHWTDVDGKQVIATAEDIITKFTNITYEQPGPAALKSVRSPNIGARFAKMRIDKLLRSESITINLPPDFSVGVPMLVDITTGPITYTGKYVVRIIAGDEQVGMLNFLDGGYRAESDMQEHSFSVLLTLPPDTKSVRLIPPARGSIPLDIRHISYRQL